MAGPWDGTMLNMSAGVAKQARMDYEEVVRNYEVLEQYYNQVLENRDIWRNHAGKVQDELDTAKARISQLETALAKNSGRAGEAEKQREILNRLVPRAMLNEEKEVFNLHHIALLEQVLIDLGKKHLGKTDDEMAFAIKDVRIKAQDDYIKKTGGKPKQGKVSVQSVFTPSI